MLSYTPTVLHGQLRYNLFIYFSDREVCLSNTTTHSIHERKHGSLPSMVTFCKAKELRTKLLQPGVLRSQRRSSENVTCIWICSLRYGMGPVCDAHHIFSLAAVSFLDFCFCCGVGCRIGRWALWDLNAVAKCGLSRAFLTAMLGPQQVATQCPAECGACGVCCGG